MKLTQEQRALLEGMVKQWIVHAKARDMPQWVKEGDSYVAAFGEEWVSVGETTLRLHSGATKPPVVEYQSSSVAELYEVVGEMVLWLENPTNRLIANILSQFSRGF